MIRARAVLGPDCNLRSFAAEGHALAGDAGYDIVCAAFSVLARTAYKALAGLDGAELGGSAPRPGSLSFVVRRPAASPERAAGIADFLVSGLGDLAAEYPGAVEFLVERDWRE